MARNLLKRFGIKVSNKALWRAASYGAILFVLWIAWISKDLPTPSRLATRPLSESTKFYDRNGTQLFENFGSGRRTRIPKEDIPLSIRQATIATEDRNFYHHKGVEPRSIARAVLYNVIHRNSTQGGSTITQQYIKNALLSPRRTFGRKIKEAILALELEQIYNKDDILTFYLNEVAYGNGNYGIEAASNMYFGKKAKDLSLSESALLAAIPVRPTYYSPYGPHRDELLARKDVVLKKMREQDYLTEAEETTAKGAKITFQPRRFAIIAPHFVLWVKDQLVDRYGEKLVNETGLKVTTSLDLGLQQKAEEV
ncbi:penicillin-binding protein, partial [Candidatus Berkelbacteria bacterium]|nr:penicillin-binding protein [Candidatus Berkelbacteria bacterium]